LASRGDLRYYSLLLYSINHLYDIEMETTEDERQGNSKGNKESQPENESTYVASVTSMDSSCSIGSSSKDGNANDLPQSSISELVGKSKKAAFSLWTLLHAKVG
jgi:hypothetical protein